MGGGGVGVGLIASMSPAVSREKCLDSGAAFRRSCFLQELLSTGDFAIQETGSIPGSLRVKCPPTPGRTSVDCGHSLRFPDSVSQFPEICVFPKPWFPESAASSFRLRVFGSQSATSGFEITVISSVRIRVFSVSESAADPNTLTLRL